jgi:hypothetical protein
MLNPLKRSRITTEVRAGATVSRRNIMVNFEQIEAEAAELAGQFWLEIEAEFTRQAAHCQETMPAQAGIPGDRSLPEAEPLLSAAQIGSFVVCNAAA